MNSKHNLGIINNIERWKRPSKEIGELSQRGLDTSPLKLLGKSSVRDNTRADNNNLGFVSTRKLKLDSDLG